MRTKTTFNKLWLLALLLLLFSTCSKRQNEMEFRIKQELLAKRHNFENINLSFSPPSACDEISDSLISTVTELLAEKINSSKAYAIIPEKIFLNQTDQFFCSVSQIHDLPFEQNAINNYQKLIRDKYSAAEVRQTQFYYQGFEIYQSLIMDPDIVQFKIFVPQSDNKSFQIDYLVPQNYYVKYMEAIESSIGSIKKIN